MWKNGNGYFFNPNNKRLTDGLSNSTKVHLAAEPFVTRANCSEVHETRDFISFVKRRLISVIPKNDAKIDLARPSLNTDCFANFQRDTLKLLRQKQRSFRALCNITPRLINVINPAL